jgi:hypothetical protein
MRAAAVSFIRRSDVFDISDNICHKRYFPSLLEQERIFVQVLCSMFGDVRLMITWSNQETGRVSNMSRMRGIWAILNIARNTPPQVDTFAYRNIRVKSNSRAARKKSGKRAFLSSVYRPSSIFLRQARACFPHSLVADQDKVGGSAVRSASPCLNIAFFSLQRWIFLFGGLNTKKEKERLEPGKQRPTQPGIIKPERGGDKGAQRVKRPKRRIGMPAPSKKRNFSSDCLDCLVAALLAAVQAACWFPVGVARPPRCRSYLLIRRRTFLARERRLDAQTQRFGEE